MDYRLNIMDYGLTLSGDQTEAADSECRCSKTGVRASAALQDVCDRFAHSGIISVVFRGAVPVTHTLFSPCFYSRSKSCSRGEQNKQRLVALVQILVSLQRFHSSSRSLNKDESPASRVLWSLLWTCTFMNWCSCLDSPSWF